MVILTAMEGVKTLADWIHFTTRNWWIWVALVAVFCTYLAWIRISRPQQTFLPLVFAGLWLAGSVTCYISTHWHHYFGAPPWLSGVASILAVTPVPLAVTFIVERAASPVISRDVLRGVVAGAVGVLVTLFIQQRLAWWVAGLVPHVTR